MIQLGIIILVVAALLVIGIIVLSSIAKPPATTGMEAQRQHVLRITRYLKKFNQYDKLLITRQSLRFIHNSLSELSIYDEFEAKVVSVKMFHKSLLIFFGITIAFILIFQDLLIAIIGMLCAYIVKDTIITKKFYKIHFDLLEQTSEAISEIRQEYLRTNNVMDALLNIEPKEYVKPSITLIYRILSSPNTEDELDNFHNTAPLKALQTLASISFLTMQKGDTRLENGQSNYIEGLSMIDNEVRFEINRLVLQNVKFKNLDRLPIIPIFLVLPIKIFFSKALPGTQAIYNGTIGYTSLVALVLASMFCYRKIMLAQAPYAVRYDDRTQFDKEMCSKQWVIRLVSYLIPNDGKKLDKLFKLIKESQTRLTLRYIYWRKFYFFVTGFVLAMAVTIAASTVGYIYTKNNFSSPSLGASAPTERELNIIKTLDALYFASSPIHDDNELRQFIEKNTRGLSRSKKDEQLRRIRAKEADFKLSKFQFWWVWIWFISGMIGWILPEILIKQRQKTIQSEAQEDCLQLQTIIAILMYTRLDTLDVLDWLSKHSRVFQPMLISAFHKYPSNPEEAILDLKNEAGLPDFKRICDKLLLTVYQVSLAEGFSDLVAERNHLLVRRNITQEADIKKKRTKMSPVSLLPLGILVATYFIAPIAILGVSEFKSSMDILNNTESIANE